MPLSESDALLLLENRVKFKLYAAEQELESLKDLDKGGISISSTSSRVPRVMWMMRIECLLAHLVGSVDALLIWINDKLGLGLKITNLDSGKNLMTIDIRTKVKGYGLLLDPLINAAKPPDPPDPPGWFWALRDLRNQGMHRKLLNIHTHATLHDDVNRNDSWSNVKVYLITDPETNLEIIPYLEDSISKTKDLIESIVRSEPSLKM